MSQYSSNPKKATVCACAACERTTFTIEHCATFDMADGQALPPFHENGVMWRIVRRDADRTLWRRIFLSASSVTDRRTVPGDFITRA